MQENPFGQHTMLYRIYELMSASAETGREVELINLKDKHGEDAPRSSISMCINKIKEKHFDGVRFYTLTKKDGRLVLGVRAY